MATAPKSAESGQIATVGGVSYLIAQFGGEWGMIALDQTKKRAVSGATWQKGQAVTDFQIANVAKPDYVFDHAHLFGANEAYVQQNGTWQLVATGTRLKDSFEQNNPSLLALSGSPEQAVPAEPAQPSQAAPSKPLETAAHRENSTTPEGLRIEAQDQNIVAKGLGVLAMVTRQIANLTNAIGRFSNRGTNALETKANRELPHGVQQVLGNGGYVASAGALAVGAVMPIEPVRHVFRDVGVVGLVVQGLYDIVGKKLLGQSETNAWQGVSNWLEARAHMQPPVDRAALARS